MVEVLVTKDSKGGETGSEGQDLGFRSRLAWLVRSTAYENPVFTENKTTLSGGKMLDCHVDVRKLSVSGGAASLSKLATLAPKAKPSEVAPPTTSGLPSETVSLGLGTTEKFGTLSTSQSSTMETLETGYPSPVVRFKPLESKSTSFNNGPLTMGFEPAYMDEIRVLGERYPGVAEKLNTLECQAAASGYCPVASKALEASVLASPPWPTTTFGSAWANISAKAQELQQSNPTLASQNPKDYDFKAANRASAKFVETLDEMFPREKYPELNVSARAKTPQSLAKKMEKQTAVSSDFSLAHLTDTVGARIDAPDLKQMGEVAKALEEKYKGNIVAKSDYVSDPGANGYRAIHYIIDIGGRMAEIQTSTTSLRAADLATHDTVYKPEFPVTPQTAQELSTAADRIMFLECLKTKGLSPG